MGPTTTRKDGIKCCGKLYWHIGYVLSCDSSSCSASIMPQSTSLGWTTNCFCSVGLWGPRRVPHADKVKFQGMSRFRGIRNMLQHSLDRLICLSCNDFWDFHLGRRCRVFFGVIRHQVSMAAMDAETYMTIHQSLLWVYMVTGVCDSPVDSA